MFNNIMDFLTYFATYYFYVIIIPVIVSIIIVSVVFKFVSVFYRAYYKVKKEIRSYLSWRWEISRIVWHFKKPVVKSTLCANGKWKERKYYF